MARAKEQPRNPQNQQFAAALAQPQWHVDRDREARAMVDQLNTMDMDQLLDDPMARDDAGNVRLDFSRPGGEYLVNGVKVNAYGEPVGQPMDPAMAAEREVRAAELEDREAALAEREAALTAREQELEAAAIKAAQEQQKAANKE